MYTHEYLLPPYKIRKMESFLFSLLFPLSSYLLQRMEAREDVEAAVREPRVVLKEDPVQVREPLHDVEEVVVLQ